MDEICPSNKSHENLITFVDDRKGHDFRYAIDTTKITKDLNWKPKFDLISGLKDSFINDYQLKKDNEFDINSDSVLFNS